jgi:hypothetical protein
VRGVARRRADLQQDAEQRVLRPVGRTVARPADRDHAGDRQQQAGEAGPAEARAEEQEPADRDDRHHQAGQQAAHRRRRLGHADHLQQVAARQRGPGDQAGPQRQPELLASAPARSTNGATQTAAIQKRTVTRPNGDSGRARPWRRRSCRSRS